MGCVSTGPKWDLPPKPETYPVNFIQRDDGLYMDKISSLNLLKNVESIDAYTEKLETMIKTMKSYYNSK